ncbi:hypothetical protein AB0I60_03390 [Actinosynnema sp. NPDC050436]|uniref:DUF7144 family membrane protein n=1 Tax=Actinosynnema sp. NPDC050436 TaxID=3155659 RepID=UPI0033E04B05
MSQEFYEAERSGRPPIGGAWARWITFAGIMLIVIGIFTVVEGLVALFHDQYYVAGADAVLVFDLTGWGWVHLVVGVVLLLTGPVLWTGAAWARIVTIVFASLNAVAQLAFVGVQPVWSTIVIALNVMVIWAVVVHGGKAAQGW